MIVDNLNKKELEIWTLVKDRLADKEDRGKDSGVQNGTMAQIFLPEPQTGSTILANSKPGTCVYTYRSRTIDKNQEQRLVRESDDYDVSASSKM
jgi:hypothetical protein